MERRRWPREAARGDVTLAHGGADLSARLVDLTRDGCRLAAAGVLALADAPVAITFLPGITSAGRAIWHDGGEIGVRFDIPLAQAAVRYFQIEPSQDLSEAPADGFGRKLPPLANRRTGGRPQRQA